MNTTDCAALGGSVRLMLLASWLGSCLAPVGEVQETSTGGLTGYAYGYDQLGPESYNTDIVGTIRYDQTLTGLRCTNETDHYPPAEIYRPYSSYCAVEFRAQSLDRINSVTVTNTNSWGTDEVQAFVLGNDVHDSARFEGSHTGNNRGEAINLTLLERTQLRRGGRYHIVFIKYAVGAPSEREELADDFTVTLSATRAEDLPLSIENPPVRAGLYGSTEGPRYFVEVLPPAAALAKDFTAWQARVYEEKAGCERPEPIAEFERVWCEVSGACWFYRNAYGPYRASSGEPWHLGTSDVHDTSIGFRFVHHDYTRLTWVRAAPEVEQEGYRSSTCSIRCVPPPPPPPSMYCDVNCRRDALRSLLPTGPWDWGCPLVMNVSGGRSISFLGRSVPFDLNGDGAAPGDWVTPDHPFIALDVNENGVIDSGRELFGTATRLDAADEEAVDGFHALAQYDDNEDGKIDAADPIFQRLLLWFDRNSNGASEGDELSLLRFNGVSSVSLDPVVEPAPLHAGAFVALYSTFEEEVCDYTVPMYVADVWFPTSLAE